MDIQNKLSEANKFNKNNEWEKAIEIYYEILPYDNSVEIYEALSWCLSNNKQYDESIKYLTELSVLNPKNAKYKYMIGYQYYCQEQWQKAIEWFEESLKINPNYFLVKHRLAYAYFKRSGANKSGGADLLKAIGQLNECHKIWGAYSEDEKHQMKSTYAKINFIHGKISMNLPKYRQKAIEFFKTSLLLDSSNNNTKYNLAKTYYLEGNYKTAKENIPEDNKFYILELDACIDAKLGNYKTAIAKIKNLLSKKKKGYLLRILSEIYLAINDLKLAFITIKEAELFDRKNHKIYYTMGSVYYKYGLFNKAVESLDKAILLKKDNFKSDFNESIDLKKEIQSKILPDYKDDEYILNEINSIKFDHDNFNVGEIIKYYNKKGFGFIKNNELNLFFHCSECKYKDIKIGDKVKFKPNKTEKGLQAVNIVKI